MEIPLQISFHGIDHSDALSRAIRAQAKKLERYYAHVMSCRVVLELAAGHKRKGKEYRARIDLKVPGGEIAVTHTPHEDLHIALTGWAVPVFAGRLAAELVEDLHATE